MNDARGRAAEVRVVRWSHAPKGGDAADAVAAGVDIAALLADAEPWTPPANVQAADKTPPGDAPDDDDPRPTIRIRPDRYNDAARETLEQLKDRVFLLGGRILAVVQHLRKSKKITNNAEAGAGAVLVEVATPDMIAALADRAVRFVKYDNRRRKWTPTPCQAALSRRILSGLREILEPVEYLTGVARVPVLLPDGRIASGGYENNTNIYVDAPPIDGVPMDPTRADAERALARLLRPFRGYGIAADLELRACIAGAALTAIARPSIRTAPAILCDGNQPGVGKGLLARALAALACGMATPVGIGEGIRPKSWPRPSMRYCCTRPMW